jgi:integrase/recombinase XerD
MTKDYPYLHSFIDARGKRRYVFRRKGHKQVTVRGKYGSPEFIDNYRALVDQTAPKTIGQNKAKAGTVDAVAIAYFKNEVFTDGLARETQRTWRRIIEKFRDHTTPSGRRYGDNPVATLNERAIKRFLEDKKPNPQRSSLKAIRALVRFAIYQGDLSIDPTENIKPAKVGIKSKGHMTWLAPQIAQYRERWPLGMIARLALELLLNIAARRHDAHELGTQHIKDGKLVWRPHKTLRSTGKLLSIRIMPELQAAMDAVSIRREDVLMPLVNDYGRSFASAAAFGNKFADWVRAAGLKPVLCDDGKVRSYRAHGLRKAALMSLAHAGATGVELMAVSGHSSLAQVQEYLDAVEQERAADAAMTKLENSSRTGSG